MKKLLSKPYILFWVTAGILILLSIHWLSYEDASIDINVHDTYFVIHNSHILQLIAFLYGLAGFTYWFLEKSKLALHKPLTQIHAIVTVIVIPIYFIGSYFLNQIDESEFPLFDDSPKIDSFITILVLVGLITQLLFLINIILSLIKAFLTRK